MRFHLVNFLHTKNLDMLCRNIAIVAALFYFCRTIVK